MSRGPVDAPAAVRDGEELDRRALADHLRRELPRGGLEVPEDADLEVLQFPSGWSNLTYLLRLGRHELVLRRPPFGNVVAGAHDMVREHRVLEGLSRVWDRVPRPYLLCEDESVIGAPFYVMERVRGVILRRELPHGFELPPERARALSEALVDGLAELHGLDPEAAGLADLGRPEGYARRQVEGWTERYHRAKTDEHPELEEALTRLGEQVPGERGSVVVHNDYKYDNLVLDPAEPSRIRAVLDWEMCTLGDPLFDLGTSLGYWVEAGDPPELAAFSLGPTAVPGSLTRREIAERYASHTGAALEGLSFYYAFGLVKIAVIVQQIHARYRAGKTQDPRFADLHRVVGLFGRLALRAAEGGEV